MPKCLACGTKLVKPEDFALGDLSKNLCAQCSHMRVSQHRPKPWQESTPHQVHEVHVRRLREIGRNEEEIKKELKKWHDEI